MTCTGVGSCRWSGSTFLIGCRQRSCSCRGEHWGHRLKRRSHACSNRTITSIISPPLSPGQRRLYQRTYPSYASFSAHICNDYDLRLKRHPAFSWPNVRIRRRRQGPRGERGAEGDPSPGSPRSRRAQKRYCTVTDAVIGGRTKITSFPEKLTSIGSSRRLSRMFLMLSRMLHSFCP